VRRDASRLISPWWVLAGARRSSIPKELPTVEEALKILAGALKAAGVPGLDRVEVQRLQAVARLARNLQVDFC
jgi:hypothetical protein